MNYLLENWYTVYNAIMYYDSKDEFIQKVNDSKLIVNAVLSNDADLKFSGFIAAQKALPFIKKESLQDYIIRDRTAIDASTTAELMNYRGNADTILLFRRDLEGSFGYRSFKSIDDAPHAKFLPWESRLLPDKNKLGFLDGLASTGGNLSVNAKKDITDKVDDYLRNNLNENFIHHCICLSEPKKIDSYWFLKKGFFIEGLKIYNGRTIDIKNSVDLIHHVQDYVTLRRMELNMEKSSRYKDLKGYFTNARGSVMSGLTQVLDKNYRISPFDGPANDVLEVRREIMKVLSKKYFNNFSKNI